MLEWNIKRIVEHENTLITEWYFLCEYEGNKEGFDGVIIADFDDNNRIVHLSEYQSKSEHFRPYDAEK